MAERPPMSRFREAKILDALMAQGLVEVPAWEEGASRWCTGSLTLPDADPPQDSYGDCTECGEPLIWVVLGA